MKMRKSIHKFLALALAICMLVPMLAACEPEVDAATIMSQYRLANSSIDLSVGDVTGISVIDESLSDVVPQQTWVSDNPAVVSVTSNGIVSAVAPGTAVVRVTLTRDDIDPFDLSCVVNVTQDIVAVESIMLSSANLNVLAGTSSVLSAVVLPTDATDKTIIWSSSDPMVATVMDGIISGVAEGTATITASTVDGLVSASCIVTVEPLVDDLTSFSISKSSASLYVGNSTTLKATYEPADAGISVVWTSSDPSVATVTDGVVKAIATGTATITASYTDKVTTWEKTCKVTVSKQSTSTPSTPSNPSTPSTPSTPTTVKATDVTLDKTSFYVNIGETTSWKIKATVTPSNTTEKGTWTSSNPSLVTIDSEGNAKVVAASLAENALETVTLTYKIGSVQAAAIVLLQDKGEDSGSTTPSVPSNPSTPSDPTTPSTPSTGVDLTALAISKQSVEVNVGDSASLTVSKSPANSDETITWSSADTSIATVDQTGKVTGVKAGSTVIYAKSSRTGMQAQSVVIVSTKTTNATAVTLNHNTVNLEAGSSISLKATLTPATATDSIVWTSSMPTVASVDQNGKVIGVAMGTSVITATTSNGLSASCVVTVSAVTIKNIQVSVKLSTAGELTNNKTYTATVQFNPPLSAADTADFYYDIWSDNPAVVNTVAADLASMSNNFTVVPDEDGTANLYPYILTDRVGFNFTYVPLAVEVNSPSADIETPVKSISLSIANGSASMYAGDKLGLSVKVSPEIHDDVLTWSTSDSSVATVENGIVTAVGPGVATITYRAKGNLSTNGVSKSIKVTVQSTGSMNEALGRVMIMQGSSYQLNITSLGRIISWDVSSAIPGITIDNTGLITVDESVAAGTTFQLVCYYTDLTMSNLQQKTFNVIVQRAVTSSNTEAYAKYSITIEDGEEYDWSDFGLNFSGYDLIVDDEDDCEIDCDSRSISATLLDDDKGSADIEVYDDDVKIAEISVSVIEKELIISITKSGTAYLEDELEDLLDVNSVNIIAVTIDSKYDSLLDKGESSSKGVYIKGQGTKGTAYIDVSYSAGNKVGAVTITVDIG